MIVPLRCYFLSGCFFRVSPKKIALCEKLCGRHSAMDEMDIRSRDNSYILYNDAH